MGEFRMPSLGADMDAGTLVEWLKHPGDTVKRGDIIAVVETQKGAIEVEVFEEGRIDKLLVAEGATVPVGTPLALIAGEGKPTSAPPPPPPVIRREASAAAPKPSVAPTAPRRGSVHASPAARVLAAEKGIDLATLHGSGPDGAIVIADVERAAALTPPARSAKPAGGLDLAEMRKAIAAAMARSKREIPHYYLGHEVDLSAATEFVRHVNAERPPDKRLLIAALLIKAVAHSLVEHPRFNGFQSADGFVQGDGIHVGVAIAIRGGGLIAPAIRDADRKTVDELMDAMRDLTARVRAGRLRSSEMTDSTITVSSLGERGVATMFGVIYPPQVALIGFGTPTDRPWCADGTVASRRAVTATLAADHRVTDGHQGALFLSSIGRRLQEPEKL